MAEQPLILLVDDEANFREIFTRELSSAGFKIETAGSGRECLEKMKTLKPALILLDVTMPEMGGPETLLELRKNEATKNQKVVFLTSMGDPAVDIQDKNTKLAQDFGATGYLKKTEDLDLIVEKVKGFLS